MRGISLEKKLHFDSHGGQLRGEVVEDEGQIDGGCDHCLLAQTTRESTCVGCSCHRSDWKKISMMWLKGEREREKEIYTSSFHCIDANHAATLHTHLCDGFVTNHIKYYIAWERQTERERKKEIENGFTCNSSDDREEEMTHRAPAENRAPSLRN